MLTSSVSVNFLGLFYLLENISVYLSELDNERQKMIQNSVNQLRYDGYRVTFFITPISYIYIYTTGAPTYPEG